VAENESRSISENIFWANQERIKLGQYIGRVGAFGYDVREQKLTPNRSAPIVREIFEAYASGAGMVLSVGNRCNLSWKNFSKCLGKSTS